MKKIILFITLILAVTTLTACDLGSPDDDPNGDNPYRRLFDGCNGSGEYVIIEGVCYPMNDIVSDNIQITGTDARVQYNDAIELMDDFVADLSGSAGLAVIDRESYERQQSAPQAAMAMEETEETGDETENIIVKLTDEGFFEEVSFTDDNGFSVEVTANPLALEIYGDFTVVIFEVDHGYQDPNQDFNSKVWDSFWSGGIYLIHNETGKLFATREVIFNEDTWTETEYYNRDIVTMATLGQPVTETIMKEILDENGEPVLDENGDPTYEEIINELKDSEGNPIIFNEGPYMTEVVETPKVEYYEEPVLDENGEPVLDENGNAVYEVIEEPVLDENGNPIIESQEVPVLDENGNPVMMETFEVRFTVNETIEVVHTNYYAQIADTPLTALAERFIQKVMEEYYNWNYYRVNEYVLHDYNFTYSNEYVYYNEFTHNSDNTSSRIVKRMSFDSETEEIVIEDYMDLDLAGFDECAIFVDPINGTIICNPWDGNIKIFSSTHGLKTIADSEHLEAIVLPNGELYFMDNNSTWVEELGYNTVMLHTINVDGTMDSSYVELGESARFCGGDCHQYFNIQFTDVDENEDSWRKSRHMSFDFPNGSKYVESADATLITIGEYESSRPVCEDANGCWYNQETHILDADGKIIARNWHSGTYYPDDTPPSYVKTYTLDGSETVVNRREYSTEVKICDNTELGCTDDLHLRDKSVGNDGIWIWGRFLIEDGDNFIDNIEMNEDNTAIYEYTKTTDGTVCDNENGCTEWIPVYYYDDEELIASNSTEYSVLDGEVMPLFIEYTKSDDTVITYRTETCNNAGCSELVEINDEFHYWRYYENGEVMLASIDYAETDREVVLTNTEERELCTDVNGCHFNDITYIIEDADGNPLYTFENGLHVEYGFKAAYKVTVSIDECTVHYQNVWSEDDKLCDDTSCNEWFGVYKGDYNSHIASGDMAYSQDETIIDAIMLPSDATAVEITDKVCYDLNGCYMNTENFKFLLEDGTDVTYRYNEWHENIDVFFEYGDLLPLDNQFYVEYELSNIEYATYRMDSWEFREGLRNMVRLDDNLYLLEKNSWTEGEYNYILSFDESVDHYRVQYTNMTTVLEVTSFNDSYIAVNEDKTAILQFTYNDTMSDHNMYYFDEEDLTDGLEINGVNDLIVNYDGSIYFKGVDNFLNHITGSIDEFGVVNIDTEYSEPVIVRVRPIN